MLLQKHQELQDAWKARCGTPGVPRVTTQTNGWKDGRSMNRRERKKKFIHFNYL